MSGSWNITKGGGNAGFNWHIGDGQTAVIAMVSTEERARLIAAAPDLLSALQRSEQYLIYGLNMCKAGSDAAKIGLRDLKMVQAAIAKATGET